LRQATSERGNKKEAIKRLCEIYQKQKNPEEIISLLQDHKGFVSDEYRHNMLADAYWQTKKYKEMLEILNRMINGITQNTKRLHRYEQMSVCYDKLGKTDKARKYYEKIISLLKEILNDLPYNTSYTVKASKYQLMGKCYMQMEQFEEAERCFEKVIEIDKDNNAALECLRHCKIKQGKCSEGEQEIQAYHPDSGMEEYSVEEETEEEQEPQSLLLLCETEKDLCSLIEKVLNEKGGKQWISSLLLLRETEKELRCLIKKVLHEKYGKKWIEEFRTQYLEIYNNGSKVQREDIEMNNKPSPNLLDYAGIRDLFEIISKKWDTCFSAIFQKDQKDKQYWEQCGGHITGVRNRVAHHRSEAISETNRSRCEEICQEILQIVKDRRARDTCSYIQSSITSDVAS
jgi:tetratricopeptide (TPR) repeat protein